MLNRRESCNGLFAKFAVNHAATTEGAPCPATLRKNTIFRRENRLILIQEAYSVLCGEEG